MRDATNAVKLLLTQFFEKFLHRKDSFVTHRAFCDALAEENYKANQTLAAPGGILQSQVQELFTSTMPSSDSCSKKSSMMNLTMSDENIDNSRRPLSLNSTGITMSSNLNPILNPRTSLACFSSADGSNISPMAMGSAFTSATALLQKAAEMGAKISDNSIAPILLRGFAGYPPSNINSSGSAPEGSSLVGSNMEPTAANMNSFCVGDTETLDNNFDPGYSRNGYTTISQTGLFDSTLNMHSENGNASNSLGGEVYMGRGEKMTLDFLGVEPTGHTTTGRKQNYEGNMMGLGYSHGNQNLNNLHSDW